MIIATVKGDLHDIGKNIVAMMLRNSGFTVIDLGKDVRSESIAHTARERGADIIALSALMTTNMLTKQASLDYGPFKVRCNAVCPGATRTAMLEEALTPLAESLTTDIDGVFARISSNVPLRRVAAPDEVTGICTFLASDDSSFMTGSVLLLDGGAAIVDVSGAALSSAGVNWGVA